MQLLVCLTDILVPALSTGYTVYQVVGFACNVLFDGVHLISGCDVDRSSIGSIALIGTKIAQFVVAPVEAWLFFQLLLLTFLPVCKGHMTHLPFSTGKTSLANFANVGFVVDGDVSFACNFSAGR